MAASSLSVGTYGWGSTTSSKSQCVGTFGWVCPAAVSTTPTGGRGGRAIGLMPEKPTKRKTKRELDDEEALILTLLMLEGFY